MNYRRNLSPGYTQGNDNYTDVSQNSDIKRVRMTTLWTRIRIAYLGGLKTSTIFGALITVAIVGFVGVRIFPKSKPKIQVMYHHEPPERVKVPLEEANEFLDYRLKDTRPEKCIPKKEEVSNINNMRVSIILHFKDEEFYNLVYTLKSIIKNTKHEEIKELIMLDDGTKDKYVQEDSAKFLKDIDKQYNIPVSFYGSEDSHGAAAVRMKAVIVAAGDTLVFLDPDVMVNKGWLLPLMAHLYKEPESLAVPHFDNVLKPNRFFPLPESYGAIFGWSLNTYWYDTFQKADRPFATAVMRGNAFAVKKEFLLRLGSFDEGLGQHGGENLELSLRTWLCGGKVEIVPCSRVAVRDAMKIVHIQNKDNIHRIAELWFGDAKRHVYRFAGINNAFDTTNLNAVRTRKSYLSRQVTCKDMDWYLSSIVGDLPIPNKDAKLLGKIKADSGHCIKSTEEDHLILVPCLIHMFDRDMVFELLDNGQIKIDDQCVQGNTYAKEVSIRDCDENSLYQTWEHTSSGLLRLTGSSLCLDYKRKRATEPPGIVLSHCEVGVHPWAFVVI